MLRDEQVAARLHDRATAVLPSRLGEGPEEPPLAGTPPLPAVTDSEGFRELMANFPSGVSVLTTVDEHGTPHGMTCTSLASVTVQPPTLLACLNIRSQTLAALRQRGWFAVNLLHEIGQGVAELFSAPVPDRFSELDWRPAPVSGLPLLTAHALRIAECRVVGVTEVGDHAVVLGEVHQVSLLDGDPLLYGRRRFARWQPLSDPAP